MKNIFSVLLIMVILFTMTACVSESDKLNETTRPTLITNVSPTQENHKTIVDPLWYDELYQMSSDEIFDYVSEVVSLSESEKLSMRNIRNIVWNFSNIWDIFESSPEKQLKLEEPITQTFENIYKNSLEQSIPLEDLSIVTALPFANVMAEYFSSNNFENPEYINCYSFDDLSESNKILVAKAFFANPLFAINSSVPCTIICSSPNEEISDMAWEHYVSLSKSTSPKLSIDNYTHLVCVNIFCNTVDHENIEKLHEIAENIIKNPNYNYEQKYSFFCDEIDLAELFDTDTANELVALLESTS